MLAWVDWRLLLGSLILLPAVYLDASHLDRPHPPAVSRHSHPAAGDRQPRHRGVRRHARGAGLRPAAQRIGRFTRRQSLHGPAGTATSGGGRGSSKSCGKCSFRWRPRPCCCTADRRCSTASLSLGDLMMFLVYLAMLLEPLAVLANSATAFQSSLAGLDRVLDLLDEPREMPSTPGAVKLQARDRRRPHHAPRRQLPLSRLERAGAQATSISTCCRARWSPWSAAAAPARRRSPISSPGSTIPPPARSSWTASTCATSTSTATAGCWASSSRTCFCSTAPWPTTSATPRATPAPRRSTAPRSGQRPRVHQRARPTATRRSSASAACGSAAASGSGSPSPGPCWPIRGS